MNRLLAYWHNHGTKIISVVSGSVAVLALADPGLLTSWFGPRGPALLALASSMLGFWRGFVNSANQGPQQ